ncbi:ATP-binding cassette domain-containing protein [Tessaracoccus sp. Z1128]
MIEAVNLTKTCGRRALVQDVSFRVEPGSVTALVGPVGSGKSTVVRMFLGQERPSTGSALINGRPYSSLERPLNTVGSLPGGRWAFSGRSARQHLRAVAAASAANADRVDRVLEMVGLGSAADHRVRLFPAGPRRRLAMAAAVLGDPDHYVFDDPFRGLGPEDARWMRQVLRRLAAHGKTVLVAGESLTEMAEAADNLLVLGSGRLIADTSVEDFIVERGKPSVRLRAERQAELYDVLVGMGASVTPRISDRGVTLMVRGLTLQQVADTAVSFGIMELAEEDTAMERALLEVTGMSVPRVATLVRGGLR